MHFVQHPYVLLTGTSRVIKGPAHSPFCDSTASVTFGDRRQDWATSNTNQEKSERSSFIVFGISYEYDVYADLSRGPVAAHVRRY